MKRSCSEIYDAAHMIIDEYEEIPNIEEADRNIKILNELYTCAEKESKLVDENYNLINVIHDNSQQSAFSVNNRTIHILYDREIDELIHKILNRIIEYYHKLNVDTKL